MAVHSCLQDTKLKLQKDASLISFHLRTKCAISNDMCVHAHMTWIPHRKVGQIKLRAPRQIILQNLTAASLYSTYL